jgi:hypothetical protein
LRIRAWASVRFSSFCVAHGNATSQGTFQIGPASMYRAERMRDA